MHYQVCFQHVHQQKRKKIDPHEDCVVASQQRKKKAANPNYKGHSKALQVVVLKEFSEDL